MVSAFLIFGGIYREFSLRILYAHVAPHAKV